MHDQIHLYCHYHLPAGRTTGVYFQRQLTKRSFYPLILFDLLKPNLTQRVYIIQINTRILWLACPSSVVYYFSSTDKWKGFNHKVGRKQHGENHPHQSDFNLENKNKKKCPHGETNTSSKSEHSLLFEQWPDKIAQSYQHKMNSQRKPQEGFHQCSGREKINSSNHIQWQITT